MYGSLVRGPLEADIVSIVNGVPLHTAFHFYLSIVLIWLKYCLKKVNSRVVYPSIYSLNTHRYFRSVSFAFLNILTTTLNHKTCVNTCTFRKDPIRCECYLYTVKIALAEKRVFLKTLSRSIYTSFVIKVGGQCVLKR